MATAYMISDDLHINHINPYTWSGAYGVNTDGFPKNLPMDGSYTTQIDETPMETSGRPDLDGDMNFNFSGPMYLKETDSSPAPFRPFPARKFEYSDGTVTWYRPYLQWPWMGKGEGPKGASQKAVAKFIRDNSFLILLVLLVLVLYVTSKKR
jgi:hypothetical protein